MWNVDAALCDPGCCTLNIYATSLQFYLDTLSLLCENMWRKYRSGAHGRSSICFNVICFFYGIVCRYLQDKIATRSPSLRSVCIFAALCPTNSCYGHLQLCPLHPSYRYCLQWTNIGQCAGSVVPLLCTLLLLAIM